MALARTQQYKPSGGIIHEFELAAIKAYQGGLMALNASGYAILATDTSGSIFLGVATETVDNSGGSAGDKEIKIDIGGAAVLVTHTAGSLALANVGDYVYADGDDAVDNLANATNPMLVGQIIEVPSATTCWVKCRPFASGADDYTITATAVVLSNMDDGSANNTLIALTGTYDATEAGKIEQNFDKIGDEVNALIVDVTAILRRLDAMGA